MCLLPPVMSAFHLDLDLEDCFFDGIAVFAASVMCFRGGLLLVLSYCESDVGEGIARFLYCSVSWRGGQCARLAILLWSNCIVRLSVVVVSILVSW